MKKRILALLLVLTMALSLFAACGEKDTKKEESKKAETEEEAPEFAKGFYAVLNEDEETIAYLHSTGKKLTVYDADGNELMAQTKFSWDDEEEAFVIDETAAFTLEVSKKTTSFSVPKKSPTGLDKGSYTLEEIEESDIPVPAAEPAPQPTPDPEPEPTPDPEPEPAPSPNANYVTLPIGYYKVFYYGVMAGYFEYDGFWLTYYDENGETDSSFLSYDPATSLYTDDTDETFHIEKTDDGFVLLEEDSDEPMELYPIDALPDFESSNPGTAVPQGEFYPDTPENEDDYVRICRYSNTVLWACIPDFFLPFWDEIVYSEGSTGNSFLIFAKNEDESIKGNAIIVMSDSYGDSPTINRAVVEAYYDKDEEGCIYDSLTDDGGVQEIDFGGVTAYYRWHDTLKDGEYETYLIILMDNGDSMMIAVFNGTTYNEDDYYDFSDIISDFASYLELDSAYE